MKYVLYHSNCYDGFGAAYAAWKALASTAKYIPVGYQNPVPSEVEDGSTVYLVDFSYKRDVLIELSKRCKVVVIDHHKTAMEDLSTLQGYPNLEVNFDMERSGAVMSWEYFHPSTKVPVLLQHIQDRDLWRFKLPGSKEVHVYLQSIGYDFQEWDKVDVELAIQQGKQITKFRDRQVDVMCENARLAKIGGVKCVIMNATLFWSEVGNTLLDKWPDVQMSASFGYNKEGRVTYSLRTRGDFDCSEVAKQFGGGGHKSAAGFKVDQMVHTLL